MTHLRQRMLEELQRRNYSPATIRSYLRCVAEFAQHFHRSPDQLGADDIRQFQLFLIKQRRLAWSTYNVFVSALRFFYVKTLKQPFIPDPNRVPLVDSQNNIYRTTVGGGSANQEGGVQDFPAQKKSRGRPQPYCC